jgi:phytoene dehydrogenase-like protein
VYDAVVVGAGPNGLAAAIEIARAGRSVLVREGAAIPGGSVRSAELTLPGFVHDLCSAVYPMSVASPFFHSLPLADHGLTWIEPPAPVAHPLEGGEAVLQERSVAVTAEGLGRDREAYRDLLQPLVEDWPLLQEALLRPILRWPRHPLALGRFGLLALRSARGLAQAAFREERARALFAGHAAHSILPLEAAISASFGLVLALTGHAVGWPAPRGGAQEITRALTSLLRSLGGDLETGAPVRSLDELPASRLVLCDVTPAGLLRLAGDRLPASYRRALARFRHGPGAFKMDWALAEPIPWRSPACLRAGTVHVGGTLAEIAASERAPWRGQHAERPFVLLAQPSLFDPMRAPDGKHTAWAYCHVPNGSTFDMTDRIESQVERFAPGFRERILARSVLPPAGLERTNPNLVGGDVGGGANTFRQVLARPVFKRVPYATPVRGLYLCSASTPPGGGVHGMCGYLAAQAALEADG